MMNLSSGAGTTTEAGEAAEEEAEDTWDDNDDNEEDEEGGDDDKDEPVTISPKYPRNEPATNLIWFISNGSMLLLFFHIIDFFNIDFWSF